jgi:hypothetical protein
MPRLAAPMQRRPRCAAASANFGDSYHLDPDLSIIKCYRRNFSFIPQRISNAPSAAIKMPDAASWLTLRPLQPLI